MYDANCSTQTTLKWAQRFLAAHTLKTWAVQQNERQQSKSSKAGWAFILSGTTDKQKHITNCISESEQTHYRQCRTFIPFSFFGGVNSFYLVDNNFCKTKRMSTKKVHKHSENKAKRGVVTVRPGSVFHSVSQSELSLSLAPGVKETKRSHKSLSHKPFCIPVRRLESGPCAER